MCCALRGREGCRDAVERAQALSQKGLTSNLGSALTGCWCWIVYLNALSLSSLSNRIHILIPTDLVLEVIERDNTCSLACADEVLSKYLLNE